MDDSELTSNTEDVEPIDDTDQCEVEKTLFNVEIEILTKDFMSQKNGTSKGVYGINVNSVGEFYRIIWSVVELHIEKELVFNKETQSYEWSDDQPNAEDLQKFVSFHDKFGKRSFEVVQLSNKLLDSWKNKKGLVCFVHVYGNILKKEQHYDQAFRQAIRPDATDRAGAVSNTEVLQCVDELKANHPNLVATEVIWMRWANWIKKQPGHTRETLIKEDPPGAKPNLLELFKVARSEPERIQEIRSGVSIRKRVNEGIQNALPEILSEVNDLINVFKSGLQTAKRLQSRLLTLEAQLSSNNNLMDGFYEAKDLSEDGFSLQVVSEINNIEDIDHK